MNPEEEGVQRNFQDEGPIFETTNLLGEHRIILEGIQEEPNTHVANKTLTEKYFYACCDPSSLDLTTMEINHFNRLQKAANESFDFGNEKHNKMMRGLWDELTSANNIKEALTDIPNEGWKEFGFQNKDPRSDIRGGGLISIENLIEFSKKYSQIVKKMCGEQNNFLYAITSINITYFLKRYFHLSKDLKFERDRKEICTRKVLKNFCSLLIVNEDLLTDVHHLLLIRIFEIWVQMMKSDPKTTLMDFGRAMDRVKKEFMTIGNSQKYKDFKELSNAIRSSPLNL